MAVGCDGGGRRPFACADVDSTLPPGALAVGGLNLPSEPLAVRCGRVLPYKLYVTKYARTLAVGALAVGCLTLPPVCLAVGSSVLLFQIHLVACFQIQYENNITASFTNMTAIS